MRLWLRRTLRRRLLSRLVDRDMMAMSQRRLAVGDHQRVEFDAHLAICPHCVHYLDSYAKTVQLEKAAFNGLDEPVPGDMPEELVKAIVAARAKEAGR